ncbi:MAG: hypothetical protein US83_C0010G0038 [Candidatus Falkowbacteria bacterium GW2011_GWC2_38_22]|uniref:Uncharacterized protein n=1 Tax=Candidatus Falkowbacteria bacterium GW2011_GWE1_38_31 TaxID=1618638 RepID=A0A0G0MZG4_9BACT|nr:MAG: hypothetical protein US73_C0005G0038 [Candidatus Falkowbacteria bacterium GW2011_GWF2_38_1205]KKQ61004.1 MAG: hypothetical protein US83_C0010G0038 [Candidatus Falkowbacteria bacterium GW2011_GWC2_38_22]KKQ63467.1 MAG: hypothetical protein US84_C0006G0070 [Candidatus Falkowbacteria bacterium GW2011_GWF1_38_22]KKQ65462.1 MAG: hypothetical protein US87_C0007G0038 [Candidatus Falkowbacteria bacterium GW2011_GWE2_38_254]KKQ70231.1 MAG: hypothetical protein US91_C0006G0070 [Candidatus Falkowb
MNKNLFRNIFAAIVMVFLFSTMAILPVSAQDIGLDYANNLDLQAANESDPKQMAVDIVKYLMTFLGIIAVVVILLGGFKWMTAAGNEDKVAEAKKLIIAGVIGLIIILCAFAIVTFVVGITNDALSGNI